MKSDKPMTQYIGVDIVEIERIRQAVARWGDRFLHRVYTDSELRLYRQKPASLAARFAGKEAVIKALQKTSGISWKHIEILSETDGEPLLHLYRKAKKQARHLGLININITLSHSRDYAVAFATGNAEMKPTPEAP